MRGTCWLWPSARGGSLVGGCPSASTPTTRRLNSAATRPSVAATPSTRGEPTMLPYPRPGLVCRLVLAPSGY